MADNVDLTRNQTLVLNVLEKAESPMSAYTLLDELRGNGIKAPLQVYWALDKLVAQGRVHRLESISAFMACQHPDCQTHAAIVFMICEKCGKVQERADDATARALSKAASHEHFTVQRSSIELHGHCADC